MRWIALQTDNMTSLVHGTIALVHSVRLLLRYGPELDTVLLWLIKILTIRSRNTIT